MQAERHVLDIPVHHHTDEDKEGDAGQFREPKLRQRSTVLGGQVGEVVGELTQPIDTGTCARKVSGILNSES